MAFQVPTSKSLFLTIVAVLGLAFGSQIAVAQSMADIVTDDFFNGIINQTATDCAGKNFYTRQAFLNALDSYPEFGTSGSADENKREIAAFFAHITHETVVFCYVEENDKSRYCDTTIAKYPCNPTKKYYGRGPLLITWNYNYGPAGKAIGFDGLNSPETVASDPVISFKTALWFWMNKVHSVVSQGFGATTRVINGGLECDENSNPSIRQARIDLYIYYCTQFNVSPGYNVFCQGRSIVVAYPPQARKNNVFLVCS